MLVPLLSSSSHEWSTSGSLVRSKNKKAQCNSKNILIFDYMDNTFSMLIPPCCILSCFCYTCSCLPPIDPTWQPATQSLTCSITLATPASFSLTWSRINLVLSCVKTYERASELKEDCNNMNMKQQKRVNTKIYINRKVSFKRNQHALFMLNSLWLSSFLVKEIDVVDIIIILVVLVG